MVAGQTPTPIREQLARLVNQRLEVVATVGRYGARLVYKNFYQQTLLLRNLTTADGAPLCDHVWLPVGERLAAASLQVGDVVTFKARVRGYHKHRVYYRSRDGVVLVSSTLNYTLVYPSAMHKLCTAAAGGMER